ncbi:TonB-linked SusC/RagA family outer membrane protein [Filimonas zeae]|uniref:SusC/RagA family TonB-linked outer membrane protein n=1 Tax=Filimonas zeae TaxID=1737353 RepID=A0A917MWJ5_9BACT|nr:SusC/RagA family TonB-linked outer membrane protein [Filimonas zeae]MDR6339130.1 TonB-linked SusC/RagA family outer membrane protein [Filimonas zeae]GGH64974.1 SusC/RagA family TonB-linked outer membrane protein [Filimonas zeae]
MKLTAGLILLMCLQVSARTYSQKISLSARELTLDKVLHIIEKQSGYGIVYPEELMRKSKTVSLEVRDKPLEEVLKACLEPNGLTWVLKNNTIIIREKAMPAVAQQLQQQALLMEAAAEEQEISGVVTDGTGAPLAGASVQLKGKNIGAVTNDKGAFELKKVPAGSYTLEFALIGYAAFEQKVVVGKSPLVVNVTLKVSVNQLDETVIIAYGSTTKRLNTGAVSSIGTDAIAKQTVTNPLTAMQGRIAGVQITQDNGLSGGGIRMQIRGQGTAAAGFIPLYVIDGVPFTLFNGAAPPSDGLNAFGISGASGSISPFSVINPDDIERIDVLKDADATAIWGSKGANGVVLITTKKGSKSKTTYNVNFYQGVGKVNRYIPMMDTKEYLAMRREAFANAGVTPTTTNAKDLLVWDTTAYTDWQKWAIGGTANISHASVGVSGGNAQNTFLINSSYHREGTVFPGSYHTNTFSTRATVGHTSVDTKFNIRLTASYTYSGNNLPITDISTLYNLAPNLPIYNKDGSLNWDQTNPTAYLMRTYTGRTDNLITGLDMSYRILPQLQVRANLGYTNTRLRQTNATPARSVNSTATASNTLTYGDNSNDNYIVEPQIEYSPRVGEGKLQLLAGTTFQQTQATGISLNGVGFPSEAVMNAIGSAAAVTVTYNNYSQVKYNGVFGRANYNLHSKYLMDITFRRDGSSRFGPGNRFGTFGAAGAAWVFSKENFMKSVNFISFGKLRASYGITGNDQIPNYTYLGYYTAASSTYSYMGNNALVPSNFANPGLKWETNKKLDIGLELGFLNDKLMVKADYYRNRSSNQLVSVPLPEQAGSNSYSGNLPALVQNKGFEFEVNATPVMTRDLKWDLALNLAFNQNKLLEFPGLEYSLYNLSYVIGYPITVAQLYQYTGPDATTGNPTFLDRTGEGTINQYDRLPAKQGTPYFGGLSSTLSWKNFTLDVAFQFNHRYGFLNSNLANNFSPFGSATTNQTEQVLNRWQAGKPVDADAVPRASAGSAGSLYNYFGNSTANWGDASFIKFKTLSLTYNLPKQLVKPAGFTNAAVFVRGQNLFVWAKQKYTYDPETTVPGTGFALGTGTYIAFPQLRVLTAGVNLSF